MKPVFHAEIEFWRARNAAFSSLYEQLNLPAVKKYVSILEAGSADQNLLTSFKAQFNELKKAGPCIMLQRALLLGVSVPSWALTTSHHQHTNSLSLQAVLSSAFVGETCQTCQQHHAFARLVHQEVEHIPRQQRSCMPAYACARMFNGSNSCRLSDSQLQVTEEARDNLKFLTTLERHFKNITSGPLTAIVDTLPPTMNALRMVWIISRYYSDDMRMGALFKRIGQEIGDRVEAAIDVKVLLS